MVGAAVVGGAVVGAAVGGAVVGVTGLGVTVSTGLAGTLVGRLMLWLGATLAIAFLTVLPQPATRTPSTSRTTATSHPRMTRRMPIPSAPVMVGCAQLAFGTLASPAG